MWDNYQVNSHWISLISVVNRLEIMDWDLETFWENSFHVKEMNFQMLERIQ